MTVKDLATFAVPYLRASLKSSKPDVIAHVGRPAWLILWPAWKVVVGPLLPVLIRIGIEIAIGLAASRLVPLLTFVVEFAGLISEKYLPVLDKQFVADFL